VSAPEAWRSMLGEPAACWAATNDAEDDRAAAQARPAEAASEQAAEGLRIDPYADSEDETASDAEAEVPPPVPLRGVELSWA
jgi:hypothetical protein